MTPLRLIALLFCALSLLLPALALAQTQACRQLLMRHDELRQLYAEGDGMAVRVPTVPGVIEGLTAARVHGVARRKLQAHGLHDPEAAQFLNVSVSVGHRTFLVFLSLRRWTDDIGYGLAGEATVWGLGGGGSHGNHAERVLAWVAQHMSDFIDLYQRAQRACTM